MLAGEWTPKGQSAAKGTAVPLSLTHTFYFHTPVQDPLHRLLMCEQTPGPLLESHSPALLFFAHQPSDLFLLLHSPGLQATGLGLLLRSFKCEQLQPHVYSRPKQRLIICVQLSPELSAVQSQQDTDFILQHTLPTLSLAGACPRCEGVRNLLGFGVRGSAATTGIALN